MNVSKSCIQACERNIVHINPKLDLITKLTQFDNAMSLIFNKLS